MKIFISYFHEETVVAFTVKTQLEAMFGSQVTVFLADDLKHGSEFWTSIREALQGADLILTVFSVRSMTRAWVNIEAGYG